MVQKYPKYPQYCGHIFWKKSMPSSYGIAASTICPSNIVLSSCGSCGRVGYPGEIKVEPCWTLLKCQWFGAKYDDIWWSSSSGSLGLLDFLSSFHSSSSTIGIWHNLTNKSSQYLRKNPGGSHYPKLKQRFQQTVDLTRKLRPGICKMGSQDKTWSAEIPSLRFNIHV